MDNEGDGREEVFRMDEYGRGLTNPLWKKTVWFAGVEIAVVAYRTAFELVIRQAPGKSRSVG